ncbi:hypothetical protein [Streptomyces sp. NPDC049906]|uniref:hypothetical protein n=1 Tax=Streptomyces sp. NPDC049906 TaxID=3155656 RepID=UPI003425EFFA
MTLDSLSIHLTLAVSQTTHHDLLAQLVRRAVDDDWLREGVDRAALEANPALARETFRQAVARLATMADTVPADEVLWEARKNAFREQTPEPLPVLTGPGGERIAGAHRLRGGAQFHLVREGSQVMLSVG